MVRFSMAHANATKMESCSIPGIINQPWIAATAKHQPLDHGISRVSHGFESLDRIISEFIIGYLFTPEMDDLIYATTNYI